MSTSPFPIFRQICALALFVAACAGEEADISPGDSGGPDSNLGSVVFGVARPPDSLYLYAASLHVVVRAGGAVVHDETIGTGAIESVPLPMEFAVMDMPDGTEVETSIDVDPGELGTPWRQLARSRIAAGRTLLQRMALRPTDRFSECSRGCAEGLTCSWDRCRDPYVAPERLERYTPDWSEFSYCKPKEPETPVVILGAGAQDFMPLRDGDVDDLWSGDQGGHHVFVALRMRNLRQQSIVKIDGRVAELDLTIPSISEVVVFPDDAASGYCQRMGIVLWLDREVAIQELFGKTLALTARVTDADGTTAADSKRVVLSSDVREL